MLLLNGDCIQEMQKLIDDGVQVDSVVTDPPYHLTSITQRYGKEGSASCTDKDGLYTRVNTGFMGKKWDGGDIAFRKATWELCFKLLKPGGHLLAFSGSRTYHRMAVAVEDAGFEIRDQIMWIYGSGFPKSMNIGKNIDKIHRGVRHGTKDSSSEMHGVKREKIEGNTRNDIDTFYRTTKTKEYDFVTEDGRNWDGWGTHLKPAHEPIVMARKPISENSVADNVLKHGTGGINIDDCRTENSDAKYPDTNPDFRDQGKQSKENTGIDKLSFGQTQNVKRKKVVRKTRSEDGVWTDNNSGMKQEDNHYADADPRGRFPANVIHDGLEESWARYFYCAKTSKSERNQGLDNFDTKRVGMSNGAQSKGDGYDKGQGIGLNRVIERKNTHPTVKPLKLMKYLCRLVTPKDGTVLDPFMGSGSTGMAAKDESFDFIGIEKEKEYYDIANSRIKVISPLAEFMK